MSLLPFGNLPPFRPRRFLPDSIPWDDAHHLAGIFDALESRLTAATSPAALEQWLLDWSEWSSAMDEESSRRYIAMSCHTDNPQAEADYLKFIEEIEPALKPRQFALERGYMNHPQRARLPQARYGVMDRQVAVHVNLFRDENVPLETEESRVGQQYQKLAGSLTVHYKDREWTLVQMGRLLEEPDRAVRQEAWQLVSQRRLKEADAFEDLFDQLLRTREQIARNAGFPDYRAYTFQARGRFDYTPADCERFHAAIESQVMPVLRELQADRRTQMGLPALRPWDLSVDPAGRPALRPFEATSQLVDGTQRIFDQLHPRLASEFKSMQEHRLLDLDNRKGKAPGGYQSTLSESRLPFIFMNAVGVQRDVETLLHEAGHAFHALATREEDLHTYRNPPIEFCEVASMSMELLGAEFLEKFYPQADARRARRDHLEGIIEVFPWIATVDAFQHWIYTHPGHSRAERRAAWLSLMDRFGGDVDWTGHEAVRASLWHRQLHIFLYPFYYVEYGIAQLGALQVWLNSRSNRTSALDQYLAGLQLGGSQPLPTLFQTAGCRFDFSEATIAPLVKSVREEWRALA